MFFACVMKLKIFNISCFDITQKNAHEDIMWCAVTLYGSYYIDSWCYKIWTCQVVWEIEHNGVRQLTDFGLRTEKWKKIENQCPHI